MSRNPSILEAARREVERMRRRAELRRSLRNPHPETIAFADEGFAEWLRGLPEENPESLVDMSRGKPVRWVPGKGWIEDLL